MPTGRLRPSAARSVALGLGVALVLGSISGALAQEPVERDAERQVMVGVSMQPDRSQATYDSYLELVGRPPAMWSFWSDWGALDEAGCVGGRTSLPPDPALLGYMRDRGTTPLLIWQPVDSANLDSPRYTYDLIALGLFDCYLESFARAVGQIPGPVLIRFAHEFDGSWFPWGIGRFTNTPTTFLAAWRHIWDIFRGPEGLAPNAQFIWSPLGIPSPKRMNELWPGEEYVDYIGLTAFNWASFQTDAEGEPTPWKSLESILRYRYKGLRDLPQVPIILTEVGSHWEGGDKATWLRKGYTRIANRYPQVVGLVYFNVDMNAVNDPGHVENWLLTMPEDGSALEAYRQLVRQRRFKGSVPDPTGSLHTVASPAPSLSPAPATSPQPGS